MKLSELFLCWIILGLQTLQAAVGCELNDPDRDIKRLFPGATNYKTQYVSITKKGGDSLLHQIELRLGDTFQGLFETGEVPYTIYEIYQNQTKIGYIHGINQKGKYGGLQIFLAVDLDGVIRAFYYQKLTSKYGKQFRSANFGQQFVGLTLSDFYRYYVKTGQSTNPKIQAIANPVKDAEDDFRSTLRGVKKNLILIDEFLLGNKYLNQFYP